MDSVLITILTSLAISLITYILISAYKAFKKVKLYILAIGNGVKVTLSDRIYQAHKYHLTNAFCSFADLKHAENLYQQYHNLGGNGSITKLMDDIRALPIHRKDD